MAGLLKWIGGLFTRKDENKDRGNWDGRFDFFLALLGYSFSPRCVWWFPALFYMFGGSALLIPYLICLLLIGVPLMALELAIGQFTSSGPTTCWRFAPVTQGLGIAKVFISALMAIYFNALNAYHLFYTAVSFKDDPLPWKYCAPGLQEGGPDDCMEPVDFSLRRSKCTLAGFTIDKDGMCVDANGTLIQNTAFSSSLLPSSYYFLTVVTGDKYSETINDLGPVRWEMALCYLACYVIVFLCLCGHLKSWGKFVYITTLAPIAILIYLLVKSQELEGHDVGVAAFFDNGDFTTNALKLKDPETWVFAAADVIFTLSVSMGGHLTMASYNRFKYNFIRDTVLVIIINFGVSIIVGYMVFSYAGFIAHIYDSNFIMENPFYALLPAAFAYAPNGSILSGLFFLAMLFIGLNFQFGLTETVRTSLTNAFPRLRHHRLLMLAIINTVFFLLGLPFTTNVSFKWVFFMDNSALYTIFHFITFFECLAIVYLYGFRKNCPVIDVRRWISDMRMMVGPRVGWVVPMAYFIFCWGLVIPVSMILIVIYRATVMKRTSDTDYMTVWAEVLQWLMAATVVVAFLVGAFIALIKTKGSFVQRLSTVFQPAQDWGPALEQYRKEDPAYSSKDRVLLEQEFTNANTQVENGTLGSHL